jgi:hypothetical protein
MAEDGYEELFARAAAIASKVPEAMQDAAFRRALDLLLDQDEAQSEGSSPRRANPSGSRKSNKRPGSGGGKDDPAPILISSLDRTAYPQVTEADKLQDKALWLLRIANEDFSIDGLSAPEISKVLKDKFRLTYSRQGVMKALDKASRLVDRDTGGAVVRYRIMAPGEAYLDNPAVEESRPASPRKPRPKKAKARATKSASGKQPKGKGRPTPFSVLEALVASGFFKEPQTIGKIRKHMEESQGRRYKANELSPALLRLLRSGRLARAKNDENQYEYSSN